MEKVKIITYSYSPKGASSNTPLKDFVQSPHFRMKNLSAHQNELKVRHETYFVLEWENEDLKNKLKVSQDHFLRQEEEVKHLKKLNKEFRISQEKLEEALSGKENEVELEVSQLQRELFLLRKENSNHDVNAIKLMDHNTELSTTIDQVQTSNKNLAQDRKHCEGEIASLKICKREDKTTIEALQEEIHQLKVGLQEAQEIIAENCPGRINRTIEESFGDGASFSASPILGCGQMLLAFQC